MGTLGDRIGRRRLLMIGAAGFGAASVLAAFSTSAEMLIAARALLGVAAATLAPSTLSLIRNMFHDPRQRTIAIGLWVTSYSAGAAIGPLIGGLLLAHFWWGSVFLISVPVMVLLLAVGPRLLPESRDPNPGRFDLSSSALSLVSVLAVIYGIKRIAEGDAGALPALSIALGLLVGAAFLRRQGKLADPMIDLRLFRAPAFSIAVAANALALFAVYGMDLFIAQYLQLVLGMSPFEAGLWLLPGAVGFIVGSNLAPLMAGRVSTGHVVAGGAALTALGLAMLTQVGAESGLAVLVAGSIVMARRRRPGDHAGHRPRRRGRPARARRRGVRDLRDRARARRRARDRAAGQHRHRRLSQRGRRRDVRGRGRHDRHRHPGVRPRHAAGRGRERGPDGRDRGDRLRLLRERSDSALGRSRRSPRFRREASSEAATTPPIAPNRWPCQEMPRCGSSPPSSTPPQTTTTTRRSPARSRCG